MIPDMKFLALYGLKWHPLSAGYPQKGSLGSAGNGFLLFQNGGPGHARRLCNDLWRAGSRQIQDPPATGPPAQPPGRCGGGSLERPQSSVGDFCREMAALFGVNLSSAKRYGGFKALRERWLSRIKSRLFRPVLLIDEAQEMVAACLNELRRFNGTTIYPLHPIPCPEPQVPFLPTYQSNITNYRRPLQSRNLLILRFRKSPSNRTGGNPAWIFRLLPTRHFHPFSDIFCEVYSFRLRICAFRLLPVLLQELIPAPTAHHRGRIPLLQERSIASLKGIIYSSTAGSVLLSATANTPTPLSRRLVSSIISLYKVGRNHYKSLHLQASSSNG